MEHLMLAIGMFSLGACLGVWHERRQWRRTSNLRRMDER